MKLLIEDNQDLDYLVEETDGKKNTYIKGIFLQAEKQNRNKRVYPRKIMEREVGKFQQLIDERRALGELGHPDKPSINLDKVSHIIESLSFNGHDVIGRAKILENTPMGKIAKTFIDENIKLGVSSRGVGSVKPRNGVNEVQDDFMLATIDIVSDPSGIDCWVDGIMESSDWVIDAAGNWVMVENTQSAIKKLSRRELQEQKLELFQKFLASIK